MTTTEKFWQAREALDQAQQELDQARAAGHQVDGPERIAVAVRQVEAARARVEALAALAAVEDAAQQERDRVEQQARPWLDQVGAELDASRRSLTEAVDMVAMALEGARAAAVSHRGLVERVRSEVERAGLTDVPRPDGTGQGTAATLNGVRVDGREWRRHSSGEVLASALGGALGVTARPLAERLRGMDGMHPVQLGELLGRDGATS